MSRQYHFDPKFTNTVINATGPKSDARLRKIMASLTRHLHDFCRENLVTADDFRKAIELLNWSGQMSDDKRNEGNLLANVLGLEALVDEISHVVAGDGATEPTVLGPFWRDNAPKRQMGDSIVSSIEDGDFTFMSGRVLDAGTGEPVESAIIDIWETAPNGKYEQQDPDQVDMNLRGLFTTGKDGTYNFYCLRPTTYSIPVDGPAGLLLQLLDRQTMRPAHIHFMIQAPGYKTIITELFDRRDKHVFDDSVFAVRNSLVVDFLPLEDDPNAQFQLQYDFKLAKVGDGLRMNSEDRMSHLH